MLKANRILTLANLVFLYPSELLYRRGLGLKRLTECRQMVAFYNLCVAVYYDKTGERLTFQSVRFMVYRLDETVPTFACENENELGSFIETLPESPDNYLSIKILKQAIYLMFKFFVTLRLKIYPQFDLKTL